MSLFLFCQNSSLAQNKSIDSLQKMLPNAAPDEQFNIYLEIAKETQRNNPQLASDYLKKAQNLIDLNKNTNKTFRFYAALSRNKLYEHKYDSSFLFADKALILKQVALDKELINVYSTIGTCHYYSSNYQKAIDNHLQALRISDKVAANQNERGGILNNISVVYIALQDWVKAEEYLNNALTVSKKYKNPFETSRANSNLAIVFAMQEKYEQSAEMFNKDIILNAKIGNKMAVSKNYNNLGVLYERKGDLKASLKNYQKGLDIAKEIDDKASVALGYQNVAIAFSKLKRFDEAIKNYEIGLSMTESLGNRNILRDGLLGISELYEEQKNFKKALEYHQQYYLLNDSIVNEKHLNSISELEIKYETEKKEKDILVLSEQQLKDKAALESQQARIKGLSLGLLGLILLFGLGFIIFRQYASNQKQKDLIAAIADTQIEERKRIAQDLHDSVGGSLALTKNKLETVLASEKEKSKEVTEFLETLSHTSEQIRQISHNMMPGELVKFGLVSAVQTTLDQIPDKRLETHLYTHDLDKRIDQAKEIHTFRIIQEIIQNVLKHAKASTLNVHLNKHAKKLSLLVEDDGIGFVYNSSATDGIGIKNIKNRVAYLDGDIQIDSAKGKGTTFNVQIPI